MDKGTKAVLVALGHLVEALAETGEVERIRAALLEALLRLPPPELPWDMLRAADVGSIRTYVLDGLIELRIDQRGPGERPAGLIDNKRLAGHLVALARAAQLLDQLERKGER